MQTSPKHDVYNGIARDLAAILEGMNDEIAAMATCACLLHERIPYASWAGFYRVVAPELLRVGPYQGSLGCLEVPFSRGVCGAAARTRTAQVVADVHQFPGHIACDDAASSEIVLPVLDADRGLVAVLDLDSHSPAAFDDDDRLGLELVLETLRPHLSAGAAHHPRHAAPPPVATSSEIDL